MGYQPPHQAKGEKLNVGGAEPLAWPFVCNPLHLGLGLFFGWLLKQPIYQRPSLPRRGHFGPVPK